MVNEKLEIWRDKRAELNSKREETWKALNSGQREVIWAYLNQEKDLLVDELVISDMWARNMKDAVEYMRELQIKKFLYTDKSTECFDTMKILIDEGCKFSTIVYKKETFPYEEYCTGILVEL